MQTWDPEQYLRFEKERTQPSIDLVARIPLDDPKNIIDIGCGPGNSTQILRRRWPHAGIVGIDKSEKMIAKARADFPDQTWRIADVATMETDTQYDLVFSNAVIQWIPDHNKLIPRLFGFVKEGGMLAVQVPANYESPLHQIILAVARDSKWSSFTSGCGKLLTYLPAEYYYNLLVSLTRDVAMWETTYYHVLESHQDLVSWYKGTAMKPFLERLTSEKMRGEFEQEVLRESKGHYPLQSDGRVLYPFKRLFFTARKS